MPTRLTASTFRQLIESRDAQFGAQAGVAFAEGLIVREPVVRSSLFRSDFVKIGIICYASVGGSGVVATELAQALADRGHEVHLVSADLPFRWRWGTPGLSFERVDTPSYPLFREPQYLIALTNTLVRVSRMHQLDILHAHYAVPHATAAYLAHQILSADNGATPPRTVTTLHGTDITLVGSDASYAGVVGFSIERSHGITAVSESLRRDTEASLAIRSEIRVIPNFLDGNVWTRRPDPSLRARLSAPGSGAVIVHVSNFRPVKRISMVLDIFGMIYAKVPARLIMIGDGPDRPAAERQTAAMGLSGHVEFVGEQQDLVPWLSTADVFLCPPRRRASASPRSRPWPAGCQSWRLASAACPRSSWTA